MKTQAFIGRLFDFLKQVLEVVLLAWHLKKQLTQLGIQICSAFIRHVLGAFGESSNPAHEAFFTIFIKDQFFKSDKHPTSLTATTGSCINI